VRSSTWRPRRVSRTIYCNNITLGAPPPLPPLPGGIVSSAGTTPPPQINPATPILNGDNSHEARVHPTWLQSIYIALSQSDLSRMIIYYTHRLNIRHRGQISAEHRLRAIVDLASSQSKLYDVLETKERQPPHAPSPSPPRYYNRVREPPPSR